MTSGAKTLLFIVLAATAFSCNRPGKTGPETAPVATDTSAPERAPKPILLFGIPSDSFNIITGSVRPNEFLSDILLRHGVDMNQIDKLSRNSAAVFDVRKIRSGNDYCLFCTRDSIGKAKYFVYEHDPSTSYVFSFNDSLNITVYRKETRSVIKYGSGTINTSLWDDMIAGGFHTSVILALSDVFAWTVDFFGLQKGDSFKVIYEELFIEDKSLGVGKILAAHFTRSGSSVYAIPLIQDGTESFFDADGNSLRKAFLKAPLQFSRISSRFSSGRMHPILRIRRPHMGVDYAAPLGTPVVSIGDGRVTFAGYDGGAGRMVRIQHNSIYSTAYLHLSRFGQGISPGSMVKQGTIVGYVGSSGLSTGPHLDFRFYKSGSPVDPLKVEAPPVEPVSAENQEKFSKIKSVSMTLLGTLD